MYYLDENSLYVEQEKLISRLPKELFSLNQLEEYLSRAKHAVKLKGTYRRMFIEEKNTRTIKINGIELTSKLLRNNLDNVYQVFPYVLTCGEKFDQFSASQKIWERYYLDIIANQITSLAQENLINIIQERHGLPKLSRMNPGSLKEWPIEEQKPLFELLGKEKVNQNLGVSLTENYLMKPTKSVSGIIFPTSKDFFSCQLCPRENCSHRQAPYQEQLAQKYKSSTCNERT